MQESLALRRAQPEDEAAVLALLSETPGLERAFDASEFQVATEDGEVVSCGRLKRHRDGSLELASVTTAKSLQGRGVGSRIIETLLAKENGVIYALALAPNFFARHGFRMIEASALPGPIREKAETLCASYPFKAMIRRAR